MEPIVEKDGKWYFWNETWSDLEGPYNTKVEAQAGMREYAIKELGMTAKEYDKRIKVQCE